MVRAAADGLLRVKSQSYLLPLQGLLLLSPQQAEVHGVAPRGTEMVLSSVPLNSTV